MNLHRFLALCHKEFCQMLRDPSSFLIGIVIPLMLIILMGSRPIPRCQGPARRRRPGRQLADGPQHPSLPRRLAIFLTALRIFHK